MSFTARFLSKAIGRVFSRYQTCEQWAVEYEEIVSARPISEHTKSNRRSVLKRIVQHLGDKQVRGVKPWSVAHSRNIAQGARTEKPPA